MKRLTLLALLLAVALPALGGLPGLARPGRPVTDLRATKDGQDVVLTWTTTPAGTYRAIVCRGLLQPLFRAEVILAILAPGVNTYRDVGRLANPRNEFYEVYALPGLFSATGLAPKAQRHEYRERPRNHSIIIQHDNSNDAQFNTAPLGAIIGRDRGRRIPASRMGTTALWDLENFPTPDGAGGTFILDAAPAETAAGTVDHQGYYAGLVAAAPSTDATLDTTTIRPIPAPVVQSRTGNVVTLTWTAPPQDVAGTVVQVQLIRSYLGAGTDPATLVTSLAPDVLTAQDDITAVTPGWYVFYALKLVYADGSTSDLSASSAPIQR